MNLENVLAKSEELLQITDFDLLYEKIMQLLTQSMNVEASSIVIKDEIEPFLYFFFASGEKAKKLKKIKIPYGKGIVSYVIKTKQSVIENNPPSNPHFYKSIDIRTGFKTRNILAAPLIGTRFIGALELINKYDKNFNKEDLRVAQFFAKFIASIIDNLKYRKKLEEENISLKRQFAPKYTFEDIIYCSKKMEEVINLAKKVAPGDANVLLIGESGTGKELIAHAIHNHSPRRNKPFIAINCAAIPETLLESEMFGHEKGSFTGAISRKLGKFELANGGTIFLDEISEMPFSLQAKLLRVLQEHEFERVGGNEKVTVDVRIIAATNKNIVELVKNGQFREDLYYRINVFPIVIPPLRHRREDIPVLFKHFYKKYGGKIKNISPKVLKRIKYHNWPGNVRELENFANRYAVLGQSDLLQSISDDILVDFSEELTLDEAVKNFKKHYILQMLKKYDFNQTKAAKALDIQRTYLNKLIKTYNLYNP